MSANNTLQLIERGAKHGLSALQVRHLVGRIAVVFGSGTWAEVYTLLEVGSGLSKTDMARALGVNKLDTLQSWRDATHIPRGHRFEEVVQRLEELTGVSREVLYAARSRALALREGGSVVRPSWAIQLEAQKQPISAYLRRLREGANLSIEHVAERLGVDADDYRAWEHGDLTPPSWRTSPLWTALGKDQGALLNELRDARDRAPAARRQEIERRKQVQEQRLADWMIEFDCLRQEARSDIARMDKTQSDPRWNYEEERPAFWYEDQMYRERRNRREQARADAGPEMTAEEWEAISKVRKDGQERRYEQLRREQEEGLW